MKVYRDVFEKIISLENLFLARDIFKNDKWKRTDVQCFEWQLEENIFRLHRDLKYGRYKHSAYSPFYIYDPKQRLIHKATVRDRVFHHATCVVLNSIFEPMFIANSFSCRIGKGTHKGVNVLEKVLWKVSRNSTRPCFALKCDIHKFFDSVDHGVLLNMLGRRIGDQKAMWLLKEIVGSFSKGVAERESNTVGRGMPIGNLTSQLFANIYLNELDQFIKHNLKIKHYVRYTDDFVIVADDEQYLIGLIDPIEVFLKEKLCLNLHQKKTNIRKFKQGVDFLGYIILPHHRVLRTKTKRRIIRKLRNRVEEYKHGLISRETLKQLLANYLGVLSHANSFKLTRELEDQFRFWVNK